VTPFTCETVYERILNLSRKCHQYKLGSAMHLVSGDLYPKKRLGTITVGLYGALPTALYQVIDVQAIDDNDAEVTAIYPIGPVQKFGSQLRSWADGSSTDCPA
jgi:hypothetical protein